MKTFFKRLLYFSLFLAIFSVVINTVFLIVIATTDWDFVKRRESLNFKDPDFEVLVLGTSLAEYGIDTELLTSRGIKSYNLAFVGSSIKTNYIQLVEYLSRYKNKPEFVILAINSHLERFDQDGIQPVVEFTMKGHKYGIKDVPISKFNWAGMELLKKAIRKHYRKTYVSFGQKKSPTMYPDNSDYKESYLDLEKYKSAYWMSKIASTCNENGIEFLLIDIPGVRETQNVSPTGPYTLCFDNGDTAILYNFNSQEFCEFIDLDRDWSGMSHFNKYGASRFTDLLLNYTPLVNLLDHDSPDSLKTTHIDSGSKREGDNAL